MECGPACGCASGSSCLNRGVTNRQPLRLGKDVKEVDSWGMDCYTRRNIIDGSPTHQPRDVTFFMPSICKGFGGQNLHHQHVDEHKQARKFVCPYT